MRGRERGEAFSDYVGEGEKEVKHLVIVVFIPAYVVGCKRKSRCLHSLGITDCLSYLLSVCPITTTVYIALVLLIVCHTCCLSVP